MYIQTLPKIGKDKEKKKVQKGNANNYLQWIKIIGGLESSLESHSNHVKEWDAKGDNTVEGHPIVVKVGGLEVYLRMILL